MILLKTSPSALVQQTGNIDYELGHSLLTQGVLLNESELDAGLHRLPTDHELYPIICLALSIAWAFLESKSGINALIRTLRDLNQAALKEWRAGLSYDQKKLLRTFRADEFVTEIMKILVHAKPRYVIYYEKSGHHTENLPPGELPSTTKDPDGFIDVPRGYESKRKDPRTISCYLVGATSVILN